MRARDLSDYLKLRRIAHEPWRIVRFRKGGREGRVLPLRLRDGRVLELRGGSQDADLFRRIFLADEYRLDGFRPRSLGCVVDLGANVGLFAARARELARRVICYEPDPECFAQLERNLGADERIVARNEAVDSTGPTMPLHRPLEGRRTGLSSKLPRPGVLADEPILVPAIDLDQLFARHAIERCDLLKVDVEGAEYDVLEGADGATLARVGRIHGEYHPAPPRGEGSIGGLVAFLKARGFDTELEPRAQGGRFGLFFSRRRVRPGGSGSPGRRGSA